MKPEDFGTRAEDSLKKISVQLLDIFLTMLGLALDPELAQSVAFAFREAVNAKHRLTEHLEAES